MLSALSSVAEQLELTPSPKATGRLTRVVGLTIEAVGLRAAVGSRCLITHPDQSPVEAEVVGFSEEKSYLVTLVGQTSLRPGSKVEPLSNSGRIGVGKALLGRVINSLGIPLDTKGDIDCEHSVALQSKPLNPMLRRSIKDPLDVGVKAINSLLSIGRGQRIGLFAGSGVGKSMLLGMITRYTAADIVVVGLIGERGREVKEFIDYNLTDDMKDKAIVVAAPADETPLMRVRAANQATRIAEYYRDQGKHVLLLMDSLSRFAQAHREIALAAGEPPANKGYPASVFARIPSLVERAGNGEVGNGSLTAIYTVLTDGGELQDPIADAVRAILDGHIVLSRELADAGHYPAIDVEASISRVMPSIANESHIKAALEFKRLAARYTQIGDLLAIGAYQPGVDTETDRAVNLRNAMQSFLTQSAHQGVSFDAALSQLNNVLGQGKEPSNGQAIEMGGPLANEPANIETA